MSFAAKIGVLVDKGSCPSGHYETTIKLDAEDHKNDTQFEGAHIGITGESNVWFTYCVFDYKKAIKVSYDYIVLRMDDKCPEGAMAFARRHDTEDHNNENSPKGSFLVWPSDIDDNARLEYCFVPKETDSKKIRYQYPFQAKYGVFANPESSSSIKKGKVKVDDEDSDNNNGWEWYDIKDGKIKDRIKDIIEGGSNTHYHTIKWVGNANNLPAMDETWTATVGVIKANNKASCQRQFTITLDTEDSNDRTGVVAGSSDHPGIRYDKYLHFDYCVIDGTDIPKARYDYVVLRTSKYCPAGTFPVSRHHDTEDSNNKNAPKKSSVVWPSVIDDNATLEYCLVPGQSNGKAYPFSSSYGVFANNPGISNIIYSEIRVDDEDDGECVQRECHDEAQPHLEFHEDGTYEEVIEMVTICECKEWDNNNDWNWYGKSNMSTLIGNIIFDDNKADTHYRYIHWNGKTLSKSAETVVEAPVVRDIAPVAPVSSIAPEIKGFGHSAVAVELKSAGNVVVSIMNIRGDVVAKVSQDNMVPGIHTVKWNSGIVPNGRYIVAVKQNGKISAKNVILK